MADWLDVPLNSGCSPPAEPGTVLLPKGTRPVDKKRVLVKAGSKERLLKVGYRSDSGGGACLSGADMTALGNPSAGRYRTVGLPGALRRDRGLQLGAAIAVLTFVAAVIAALAAYDKASAPATDTTTGPTETQLWIAAGVLAIALALALAKFAKDWRDL